MIERVISYDHRLLENGLIEVRQIERLVEEGAEIAKTFKRHVVGPGDDITNEDPVTKQLAVMAHTDEAILAHINRVNAIRQPFVTISDEAQEEVIDTQEEVIDTLEELTEAYKEASIVSEGETIEGENEKKVRIWASIKNFLMGRTDE